MWSQWLLSALPSVPRYGALAEAWREPSYEKRPSSQRSRYGILGRQQKSLPDDIRFTYRVGGILIQREHVLCQSAGEEGFWFLPGGRAEVGEPARVTLLRETQEELGEALQIERLLFVVENFFTDASGAWHELGLYFLLSAPADSLLTHSLETFTRLDEVGHSLRFDWLPIAQLETFALYPPFFRTALKDLPDHPVHREEHRSRFEQA